MSQSELERATLVLRARVIMRLAAMRGQAVTEAEALRALERRTDQEAYEAVTVLPSQKSNLLGRFLRMFSRDRG
jgi:hypothetical protein